MNPYICLSPYTADLALLLKEPVPVIGLVNGSRIVKPYNLLSCIFNLKSCGHPVACSRRRAASSVEAKDFFEIASCAILRGKSQPWHSAISIAALSLHGICWCGCAGVLPTRQSTNFCFCGIQVEEGGSACCEVMQARDQKVGWVRPRRVGVEIELENEVRECSQDRGGCRCYTCGIVKCSYCAYGHRNSCRVRCVTGVVLCSSTNNNVLQGRAYSWRW